MSNSITTIATLLSGGEGVGVGARDAGLRHLWGIEKDDDIADVARDNGFNVITAAIQDVDPNTLEAPDMLHASPECQNASNAKTVEGADTLEEKETRLDVEIAGCIVRYLEVLQPGVFTLENVYGYRRFQSFRMILVALAGLGYFSDVQHLNAADFGVPQTRRRLILRAVRGGLVPTLPAPEPWVGWYEAIEDLVPTLPESEFAPWQQIGWDGSDVLISGQYGQPNTTENREVQRVGKEQPSFVVVTGAHKDWRCSVDGKQHKITSRALARFQSFPDSYRLPDHNGLACRVIGNAVAPLMYEKIMRIMSSTAAPAGLGAIGEEA